VLPHRGLRGLGVAPLDGAEDAAVPLERALRPPGNLQGARAALAQEVHQDVEHAKHDAVPRRQRQRVVEVRVLVDGLLAPAQLGLVALEDLAHLGDLLRGGVLRGARGQAGLDHPAHVEQLGHQLALAREHERERHHQRVRGEVAHHRAMALPRLEDAHHFQGADGVADRAAPHAQLRGQLPLGRKQVSGLQRAAADQPADLLRHLLVAAHLAHRLEAGRGGGIRGRAHWSDHSGV